MSFFRRDDDDDDDDEIDSDEQTADEFEDDLGSEAEDDDDDDDVDPLALLAAARERTKAIPLRQPMPVDSETDDSELDDYTTDEDGLDDDEDEDDDDSGSEIGSESEDESESESDGGSDEEDDDNDDDDDNANENGEAAAKVEAEPTAAEAASTPTAEVAESTPSDAAAVVSSDEATQPPEDAQAAKETEQAAAATETSAEGGDAGEPKQADDAAAASETPKPADAQPNDDADGDKQSADADASQTQPPAADGDDDDGTKPKSADANTDEAVTKNEEGTDTPATTPAATAATTATTSTETTEEPKPKTKSKTKSKSSKRKSTRKSTSTSAANKDGSPRRKNKSKKGPKSKRASRSTLEMLNADEPLDAADLLAFAKRRTAMTKSLPSSRRHTQLDLDSKQSFQLLATGGAPANRRASNTSTPTATTASDSRQANGQGAREDANNNSNSNNNSKTPGGFLASAVSNLEMRRQQLMGAASGADGPAASKRESSESASPTKLMGAISNAKSAITAAAATASATANAVATPGTYSLEHHAEFCNLRAEATINTTTVDANDHSVQPKYFQYCDISHMLIYSSDPKKLINSVKDYVSPVPEHDLKELFCGLQNPVPSTSPGDDAANIVLTNVLPVRTMAIRVRPDVSTTSIMSAVQAAFDKQPGIVSVLKREAGHFQGLVDYEDYPATAKAPSSSFVIDAQIVTQAYSANLERRLLIRIFHPWHVYKQFAKSTITTDAAQDAAGSSLHSASSHDISSSTHVMSSSSTRDVPLNLLLKQASSMIQYLNLRRRRGSTNLLKNNAKEMTQYLLNQYKDSPTVRTAALRTNKGAARGSAAGSSDNDDNTFLPALSFIDWMLIQSSWTLLFRIWKELTAAKCEFSCLESLPLGGGHKSSEDEEKKEPAADDKNGDQANGDDDDDGEKPATADKVTQKATTSLLDSTYIEQLRTIAKNILLAEVDMVNQELLTMEETNEATASNFISLMSLAYAKYELERPPLLEAEDDMMDVQPDGSKKRRKSRPIKLELIMEESADALLKDELESITTGVKDEEDGIPRDDHIAFCEYVVKHAYAALSKQADHAQAQYMREKNLYLMRRHNTLETHQHTLIEHLCDQDNDWTMGATHTFAQLAQKASNMNAKSADNKKGRRLLKFLAQKQLPVFDFSLLNNGGQCFVTKTLFLVSTIGVLRNQTKLFELQQIYFKLEMPTVLPSQAPRAPTTLVVFETATKKRLMKLKPEATVPIERLLLFLKTLQEFQAKFYPTESDNKFVDTA